MGTDWSALGNLAAGLTGTVTKPGSAVDRFNQTNAGAFQEQQVQEALRKEQAKLEKAKKGKMFGSIGSTLGTLGGVALAPLTGGASLAIPAALGAAGGAIGGAVGELAGGGRVAVNDVLGYGARGAASGLMGGMGAAAKGPMEAGMGAGGNLLETGAAGIGKSAFLPTSGQMVKSTLGSMFSGQLPNIPLGGIQGGGYQAPSMGGGMANRMGMTGNSYMPSKGALKMDANTGEYYYTPWGY
jgi:hypothetical protein